MPGYEATIAAIDEPLAAWRERGARARALVGARFSEAQRVPRVEALLLGEAPRPDAR